MVQYLMSKNEDLFIYQGQNTVLSSVTHSMFVQTGMNLQMANLSFLSFPSLCLTVKGKGGGGISNATFNKENSSPKLDEHIDLYKIPNNIPIRGQ